MLCAKNICISHLWPTGNYFLKGLNLARPSDHFMCGCAFHHQMFQYWTVVKKTIRAWHVRHIVPQTWQQTAAARGKSKRYRTIFDFGTYDASTNQKYQFHTKIDPLNNFILPAVVVRNRKDFHANGYKNLEARESIGTGTRFEIVIKCRIIHVFTPLSFNRSLNSKREIRLHEILNTQTRGTIITF